jgi:hypothetical protein
MSANLINVSQRYFHGEQKQMQKTIAIIRMIEKSHIFHGAHGGCHLVYLAVSVLEDHGALAWICGALFIFGVFEIMKGEVE